MTKKTYIALAKDIKTYFEDECFLPEDIHELTDILVKHLKQDNPNFDETLFVDACTPEEKED